MLVCQSLNQVLLHLLLLMQIIAGGENELKEKSEVDSSIQADNLSEAQLPGNERGARQTNSVKPQPMSDRNTKQIEAGLSGTREERNTVTIDIGGVPIIIPDFEITAKPQIEAAVKDAPTQIQTRDPIIAEPNVNKRVDEVETLPDDMQYFSTSSESFKNLQESQKHQKQISNDTIDRFPQSHKTWRSSGPNHVFEIHVPFETSKNKEKQTTKKNIKSIEAITNPPSLTRIDKPRTDTEIQTMIKFVISETEKNSESSQTPILEKILKASEPELENEVEEPEPCPGTSLEQCVDDCIVLEDIYAYSGCVVQCGQRCAEIV